MSDLISKRFVSDAILHKISELNAQGKTQIARELIRFKRSVDGLTPSAEAVHEWIPVSERLPEDEKIVLVTDDGGIVRMMSHEYIPNGGYWFTAEESIMVGESEIGAWMPLPTAYHGGRRE